MMSQYTPQPVASGNGVTTINGYVAKFGAPWGKYENRLARYNHCETLYTNTMYTKLSAYSTFYKRNRRLYKNIRGVYNPYFRYVQLYRSKLYGGFLDYKNLTEGAIPIVDASEALIAAIRQLWLWSNWGTKKSLYAGTGTKLGDVFLQIVDEPEKSQVRMEVLHPSKVRHVQFDGNGDIIKIVIEYPVEEEVDPGDPSKDPTFRTYKKKMVITREKFYTYKDGKPWGYSKDSDGNSPPDWDNEYGFVPVSHCMFIDEGFDFGATSFHAMQHKIDELNELVSLLDDQIFKAITVIWAFPGTTAKEKVKAGSESTGSSTSEKDQLPALYLPEGAGAPVAMVWPLDIAATVTQINELLKEIERDLPELVLHRIRESGAQTAPGMRAAYSDASDRITEVRGNFDAALVKAHKMAIAIGGFREYRNFEAFDLESLVTGELDHYIGERPIIPDALSMKEEFDVLRDAQIPAWVILEKLGYSQQIIDRVVGEVETQERNAARGLADSLFGTGDDEEDEEEIDDDAPVDMTPEVLNGEAAVA